MQWPAEWWRLTALKIDNHESHQDSRMQDTISAVEKKNQLIKMQMCDQQNGWIYSDNVHI